MGKIKHLVRTSLNIQYSLIIAGLILLGAAGLEIAKPDVCEASARAACSVAYAATKTTPTLISPIANFPSRVTKKPFGIFITPKTSPIQPERFRGYHTGADAETTTAEKKKDIPVYAVANGMVVYRNWVNGYGGVVILRISINGQTYTVLYGHIRLSSVKVKVGQTVKAGTQLAVLGARFSTETNGERKHLHFSVHKGSAIVLLGYTQTKAALSGWVDPLSFNWK